MFGICVYLCICVTKVTMTCKKSVFWLVFVFLVLKTGSGFSQSYPGNLKAKRQKLEKEIAYTNKLLSEVSKSKRNTLYQLRLINKRLAMRQNLVTVLKKEIAALNDTIVSTGISLRDMNRRLDTLKKEYAQIAWYLYKNDNSYNRLIFLFSARDFNQAYQRLRYLDEISSYIRKEAGRIKQLEQKKTVKLNQLLRDKAKKKQLLDNETTQLLQLQLEQQQKSKLKQKLSRQQRALRARLQQKQKEARQLQAQIEKVIAASAKRSAHTLSKKMTATEMKLSSTFLANKGHLPWPVKKGIIAQTFGIHYHPVLKHVQIKNNGIDIATAKGSIAHAVFPGKVVNIVHITNTNIAVILKHGDYYTVYSGLDRVLVKVHETLSQNSAIGVVHTNLQGKTVLHFEVWHNKVLQNPAYWIRKK
jgi:septal ring factor EnvC (AmiA/AmiB activator)